jgi:hypothetical protein
LMITFRPSLILDSYLSTKSLPLPACKDHAGTAGGGATGTLSPRESSARHTHARTRAHTPAPALPRRATTTSRVGAAARTRAAQAAAAAAPARAP